MRMAVTRFYWEPDIPEDVCDIIRPFLDSWKELIPTWCQDFTIRYDHSAQVLARTIINYSTRWAVVVITPEWIAESEKTRENAVIHELIHLNLEPLQRATGQIIKDVIEEETPIHKLATTMFEDGMESAVQDLAKGIERLLNQRRDN